jgi:hypothetical protein
MIQLIDEANALSKEEFIELKNFIIDHCLCMHEDVYWLKWIKVRNDGSKGYLGYWSWSYEQIGLDIRNVQAVIVLNSFYLKTLDQFKRTLAHEYGHHWTLGNILSRMELGVEKERLPLDYYRKRGLSLNDIAPDYSKGWSCCDKEILAEDYKYYFTPYTNAHRMKSLVGDPSKEVKLYIWSLGTSSVKSWLEMLEAKFRIST